MSYFISLASSRETAKGKKKQQIYRIYSHSDFFSVAIHEIGHAIGLCIFFCYFCREYIFCRFRSSERQEVHNVSNLCQTSRRERKLRITTIESRHYTKDSGNIWKTYVFLAFFKSVFSSFTFSIYIFAAIKHERAGIVKYQPQVPPPARHVPNIHQFCIRHVSAIARSMF